MIALESGRPCPYCNVRPDVACRHRPADPTWRAGDRFQDRPPPDKSASGLSGIRTFTHGSTGKTYRIIGTGEGPLRERRRTR